MGPRPADSRSDHDLFRTELVNLIDQRHELVRLAALIDWQAFASEWSPQFTSTTGRPALPTRLMAALLTLCLVALLAWLAHHRRVEPSAPYAATPVALVALWLSVWPPSPRQLRRVGWTLVGATLATTVILVETLA